MPTDAEIRGRINAVDDEQYRLAFMFQYLVAGRISEVCGKYAPKGVDAIPTDFDGEEAVLFIVRTAKREGRLRPVALPLNDKYEPWASPVYEYFASKEKMHPFKFADKWATSVRYMQWEAEKAFSNLEWPLVKYTMKKNGRKIKVPSRWKNVTSHVLRKRRSITLMLDYDFDHIDLSIYGGWTIARQSEGVPQALRSYLHVDPQSSQEPAKLLKKLARRYFHKLCRPYSE